MSCHIPPGQASPSALCARLLPAAQASKRKGDKASTGCMPLLLLIPLNWAAQPWWKGFQGTAAFYMRKSRTHEEQEDDHRILETLQSIATPSFLKITEAEIGCFDRAFFDLDAIPFC
eukprot:691236-Pelagomonas_calceolata.AAC.1